MKENPYDRVVTKTQKRIESVSDRIARNFKGTNPFDKEPLDDKELVMSHDMLTPQDVKELIDYHGYETVNELFGEIEGIRSRMEARNA